MTHVHLHAVQRKQKRHENKASKHHADLSVEWFVAMIHTHDMATFLNFPPAKRSRHLASNTAAAA
jgi:hypothetical protein